MTPLRTVGLQPFSRPGEQKGFVLEMKKDEDFNLLVCEKIPFKHNPQIAEFIFNYTNRSRKLFPDNILDAKATQIVNSKRFSRMAYQNAKDSFYPDVPDSVLEAYLKDENISIVDEPIVRFTEEEKEEYLKEWEKKGLDDFQKKIIVRYCYTGPIEYVNKL